MQTREIGGPTLPDHEEQGGDAAERNGSTGPRHPRQRNQFPQAADELSAPGIPRGYGAGAQREERLEQREEQIARTTPHGSGGELSPHRPISSGLAPLRKALDKRFRRDRNPPLAHDAHVHSRSNARATAGETGPADAGGQGNAPCDEKSRAAGASQEGENVEPRTDIQTHGEQANADERSGERENGGDTSGGHGNGSVTPRVEANEVTAVISATAAAVRQRDDRSGGSPAYRRGPPMNDGEANAPGAPQPLRRSSRRTPHAQAPPEARIRLRAEPEPASDPQSANGSHPQTPAEQQVRSRQDMQEEADREQDQPLRRSHGPEHQGSPSAPAQGASLARDEPITPISQAQQAAPVAATPRSGRGSTRGRGGRRGARGGQRSAGQAARGNPHQSPSPIWLGEPAERVTRQSFARRGARGGTTAQAGRIGDTNAEGSGDEYVPSDLRQPDNPDSPRAEAGVEQAQQQERGSGRRQNRRPQPPPDQALSASQLASREDLFEIAMSWDSTILTSTTHLPIVRRLPPQILRGPALGGSAARTDAPIQMWPLEPAVQ
ncbi:unnamed protein product [Closterium sp. Naga37s-1]|nr:unnamed protein product [Closterium sp. Naga37s-1]